MSQTRFLNILSLLSLTVMMTFMSPPGKITIYLIGDSTMATKQTKTYPETGWVCHSSIFLTKA